MTSEPVVESARVHVAGSFRLTCHPVLAFVHHDLHRDVAHLRDPHKPVALEEALEKVDADGAAEPERGREQNHVSNKEQEHQEEIVPVLLEKDETQVLIMEVRRKKHGRTNQEPVVVLEVVRHDALAGLAPFLGGLLTKEEHIGQSDIGVLHHRVGLAMVPEMAVVPPLGRGRLKEADHKFVCIVVEFPALEDGKMTEVVLKPTSLRLATSEKETTKQPRSPTC
mmetsp:Transcript_9750/g.22371  ORF Transcript_9750/g.22371 Transcript_9750/m.22371 type:complete len:224 (-) Transcript_9750:542-1213(-)